MLAAKSHMLIAFSSDPRYEFLFFLTPSLPPELYGMLHGGSCQCSWIWSSSVKLSSPTDLPSPPRTPSSTVQQYGQDSVTFTVQWQSPLDNGGAPVNYTITVSPGLSPVTTSGTSVPVTVPYNVIHTVSIVATNCIGNSSAVMKTLPAVGEWYEVIVFVK